MNTLKKITQPGVKASLRVVMVSILSLGLASVAQAMDCEEENAEHGKQTVQLNRENKIESLFSKLTLKGDQKKSEDMSSSDEVEKKSPKEESEDNDEEINKISQKPNLIQKDEQTEEYEKSDKNKGGKLGKRTRAGGHKDSEQEILQITKKYSPEHQHNS